MRFSLRFLPSQSESARDEPRSLAIHKLQDAGLSARSIGATVDLAGDWTTVTRVLGELVGELGVDDRGRGRQPYSDRAKRSVSDREARPSA